MCLATAPQGPDSLDIAWHPTPDASVYKGRLITGAIIHFTAGGAEGAVDWLTRRDMIYVSAHYVIGRSGSVTQLCRVQREAWHAGRRWGRANPNRWTVGYELASPPGVLNPDFTDEQIDTLARLLAWLYRLDGKTLDDGRASATVRMPLPYYPAGAPAKYRNRPFWHHIFREKPGFIIGHSAVHPSKPDPGGSMPWATLLKLVDKYREV
jgi:N-acetyl-anhydromuramyl-L-alanine amidase AmpD